MLYAFAALLFFQLLGELLVRWLGVDLPGPLAGALLLLLALIAYGRIPAALEQTSAVMLQNLMLLFIPTVVAIMLHGEYLAAQWLPFVGTSVLATIVTLVVTALTFRAVMRRMHHGSDNKQTEVASPPASQSTSQAPATEPSSCLKNAESPLRGLDTQQSAHGTADVAAHKESRP